MLAIESLGLADNPSLARIATAIFDLNWLRLPHRCVLSRPIPVLINLHPPSQSEYRGPSIPSVSQKPTTTMRITSQKRARRNSATATASTSTRAHSPSASGGEKDARAAASASRAVWNSALQLPTELIYTIVAIAIGDYVGDMMLFPSKILQWDAILALLHVSCTFRGCTIKLLYFLWGDTFIREETKYVPAHPISSHSLPRLLSLLYVGG